MVFRPNPGHLSMADTCIYCIALHNVPRDRLNVLLTTGCSGSLGTALVYWGWSGELDTSSAKGAAYVESKGKVRLP